MLIARRESEHLDGAKKRSKTSIVIDVLIAMLVALAVVLLLLKIWAYDDHLDDEGALAQGEMSSESELLLSRTSGVNALAKAFAAWRDNHLEPIGNQRGIEIETAEPGGDYTFSKMAFDLKYDEQRDCTIVFIDGEALEDTIAGDIRAYHGNKDMIGSVAGSLDGSKYLVVGVDGGVYLVTATGLSKIAEDGHDIEISPSGNTGVYTSESGMYIFSTSGDVAPVKISDDKWFYQADFSPDGNTLVYNATYPSSDPNPDFSSTAYHEETSKLKIYKNGAVTVLEENAHAFSTSNGGEYVYFRKASDGSLHLANAMTGETKMVTDICIGTSPIINKSGTEIIYTTIEGVFYCEKAGEAHKISDNPYGLVGSEFEKLYHYATMITPDNIEFFGSKVLGSDSLKNKLYKIEGEIVYLGDNADIIVIATRASTAHMTASGKTLYYLEDEMLHCTNVGAGANPERIAYGVHAFRVSADQRYIFFTEPI